MVEVGQPLPSELRTFESFYPALTHRFDDLPHPSQRPSPADCCRGNGLVRKHSRTVLSVRRLEASQNFAIPAYNNKSSDGAQKYSFSRLLARTHGVDRLLPQWIRRNAIGP